MRGRWAAQTSPLAVHAAIPPVLDCVVAAVTKASSDFRPALPHLVHQPFNLQTLLGGDRSAVQRRLKILMETFPALLGRAVVHVL